MLVLVGVLGGCVCFGYTLGKVVGEPDSGSDYYDYNDKYKPNKRELSDDDADSENDEHWEEQKRREEEEEEHEGERQRRREEEKEEDERERRRIKDLEDEAYILRTHDAEEWKVDAVDDDLGRSQRDRDDEDDKYGYHR